MTESNCVGTGVLSSMGVVDTAELVREHTPGGDATLYEGVLPPQRKILDEK